MQSLAASCVYALESQLGSQGSSDLGAAAAVGLAQAMIPALLMNIAIVGFNQLYDVEIDKVNKPYLPLASGELTIQQARFPSLIVQVPDGTSTDRPSLSEGNAVPQPYRLHTTIASPAFLPEHRPQR